MMIKNLYKDSPYP